MAEINEMDGYEKIDNYNYKTVNSMARHYREILR